MGFNKEQLEIIEVVKNFVNEYGYYLAGGTAIAYYLNHRESEDLDFFIKSKPEMNIDVNDFFKGHNITFQDKYSIYVSIFGVKTSFTIYSHPLLFDSQKVEGISVANIMDILQMKIKAITSRDSKRDFVDVYFIMKELNMNATDIIDMFLKKYGDYNPTIICKTMVDFAEVENQLMPKLIKKVSWEEIKEFLIDKFVKFT